MLAEARPTLFLCLPSLELSDYWTMLRHAARARQGASRFALRELAAGSVAQQEAAVAAIEAVAGDVLVLRPLQRDTPALLPALARLHGQGVRIILLSELLAVPEGVVHASVVANFIQAFIDAAQAAGADRAILLGSAPGVVLPPELLNGHVEVEPMAACSGSAPGALFEHGKAELSAYVARFPDAQIDLVLAVDDSLALGAAAALAGTAARVIGSGASGAGLQAIGEGRLYGSLFAEPDDWLDAVDAAIDASPGTRRAVNGFMVTAQSVHAFMRDHAALLLSVMNESVREFRAARTSSDFYESVIENMPAMVFVKRMPDLSFHYVNKARERWLDMPREQILGRTAYDFWERDMADVYTARDLEVFEAGAAVDQPVITNVRADGEVRFVLTRKIPLMDANGHPAFLLGISLDVSERERAERDLAKRQRELEAAHETLQKNQHQLLVAEKMAALGRLTAGIAHEMNTPLAAIRAALSELGSLTEEYVSSIGDAEVTADDHREIAAEMARSVELAARSAQRAASFVHSIKHHTRQDGDTGKISFDMLGTVRESVLLLHHLIRQNGCTVHLPASTEALMVTGTPGGLGQIVTNLLTNAIDARVPGRPLEVHIEAGSADGQIRLRVRDNGSGIAPADLARIFDPMFTTKPFGQGTGLGLAIVHQLIVEQFGGSVAVDSIPGTGTTFTIHFPILS